MRMTTIGKLALMCSTSLMAATAAMAQDAPPPPSVPDEDVIVVTGSQIQGAQINDVLPVTVLTEELIEAIGAASGEDLFRAIPQVGTASFNEQNDNTSNNARGDVASVNLRDLGTGNTLLLINGRRMALNPGFQTELLVPVVSADANEIAPGSVRRLEVLRDGASAIYGADAVAGVVNTILRSNLTGGFIEGEYRKSTGVDLYSTQINGGYGLDFAGGRGNISLFGGYFHENGLPASARLYAGESDRRPLVEGTDFEGDASFNNRNTFGPFGQFDIQAPSSRTPIGDDDFYLQPDTFPGCRLDFGNGICARNGTTPTTDVRYNTNFGSTLISSKNRYNATALINYEISDAVEAYFEGTYYRSKSRRNTTASTNLGAQPFRISRNAYYNPFGPTMRDGQPNPFRLPGTTIAAGGADVDLERLRTVDVGNREVTVEKDVYRIVGGLRGKFGDWEFDSALLYSQANSIDLESNRVSRTLFQQAVNLTTPDAYNPFNGGCLDDPGLGDCTPNPESVIDTFRISVFRKGETTLALADFKVSNNGLFTLPGGDVGVAAGVEFRRETFIDDRDPRLDGTITFTDAISGEFDVSDVAGTSPSPDTSGNREVYSAFAEAFIPLVGEDMEIPLVKEFTVQLAGRAEHFSDVNETAVVPRIAAAWTVVDGLMLRGAWSRGFRAPNLVQVNDEGTTRVNTRDDFVICQAAFEKGGPGLDVCPGESTVSFRSGTDQLNPEKSRAINLGVVLEPNFVPGLTLTADYWNIEQTGIIGVFDDGNAIALDLLRRLNGSTNPNVIRADPDADQIALFTGTSLVPTGDIIRVLDPYLNLDSRKSKGWDFGLFYDVPEFGLGDFRLRFNAARLVSFVQNAGPDAQELLDAIAEGKLPSEIQIEGLGQLLEREGRPKWRFSSSILWSKGDWDASLFGQYVGEVYDPGVIRDDLLDDTNDPTINFYRVSDLFTVNATVTYTFDKGPLDGTRIRLGVNNIFDKDPPLADQTYGFFSDLHSPRGRVVRIELRKKF